MVAVVAELVGAYLSGLIPLRKREGGDEQWVGAALKFFIAARRVCRIFRCPVRVHPSCFWARSLEEGFLISK